MESNSRKERLDDLLREYWDFLATEEGQDWKTEWEDKSFDDADAGCFGDYLYDFHPEMLQ